MDEQTRKLFPRASIKIGMHVVWAAITASLVLLAVVPDSAAQATGVIAWQERFDRPSLGWVDPFNHPASELRRVYAIEAEGPMRFLRARHDATASSRPPAMHFGKAFQSSPVPLSHVQSLAWKWRVRQHPTSKADDPWLDCAGGVYVVIRQPSLFKGGRGFKFGWLALPGPSGTRQHGLLQVPLRSDPPTATWRSESVDLCGLYRKEYGGSCDGESVLYVGVVTDADGTRSVAEADYADFELRTTSVTPIAP